jgi:hypothetical protein
MRSSTELAVTGLRLFVLIAALASSTWSQGGGVISGVPPRPAVTTLGSPPGTQANRPAPGLPPPPSQP